MSLSSFRPSSLPKMSSMSLRGGKRTRPLGSLRHMITPDDTKLQLPKLSSASRSPDEDKIDGVQGSAMTLPSPKESARSEERRRSLPAAGSVTQRNPSVYVGKPSSVSSSNEGGVSHEACERELKEVLGRERDLKERLAHLQKQVEQLTTEIGEKDNVIVTLNNDIANMEERYKQQLVQEQLSHQSTREDLESAQDQIQLILSRLEAQEKESKEKMDLLRMDLTRQMTDMAAAKDRELADKDQKLGRLKMQMADALKGNSWERQQQLEELTKDLARVQEECDVLRSKLKNAAKGSKPQAQSGCGNCADAIARADKLAATLKERESTLKELKSLCSRFEKQVAQQDALLKQSADGKGHKVDIPK